MCHYQRPQRAILPGFSASWIFNRVIIDMRKLLGTSRYTQVVSRAHTLILQRGRELDQFPYGTRRGTCRLCGRIAPRAAAKAPGVLALHPQHVRAALPGRWR